MTDTVAEYEKRVILCGADPQGAAREIFGPAAVAIRRDFMQSACGGPIACFLGTAILVSLGGRVVARVIESYERVHGALGIPH